MNQRSVVIIGAGIAGLGASYALRKSGVPSVILEKDCDYGGLCGSFEIEGFRFDRFVHLSHTQDEKVKSLFLLSSPELITHIPNPYNIYKRMWIKHPAQNNLFPLAAEEKELVINDFLSRPKFQNEVQNYEQWLRLQYGNYFAEHFPMVYTRKYWMKEARDLRTEWVGKRLYQPSVDEVIMGSKSAQTPMTYYAKEMRYPKTGGYRGFLKEFAKDADIRYLMEIGKIDAVRKLVYTKSGDTFAYDRLISSMPLPELVKCLHDAPERVVMASDQLECTSGYHISVGLKTKNIPPYLWWYIYDEDILSARVYSPSLKSSDNAPEGCSSLQIEIYCKKDAYTESELLQGTVGKFIESGIIRQEDVLFSKVDFEPYANVIFSKPIYQARKIVRDYLLSVGIETIGRFGEWDYLWSDQSLISGMNVAHRLE